MWLMFFIYVVKCEVLVVMVNELFDVVKFGVLKIEVY